MNESGILSGEQLLEGWVWGSTEALRERGTAGGGEGGGQGAPSRLPEAAQEGEAEAEVQACSGFPVAKGCPAGQLEDCEGPGSISSTCLLERLWCMGSGQPTLAFDCCAHCRALATVRLGSAGFCLVAAVPIFPQPHKVLFTPVMAHKERWVSHQGVGEKLAFCHSKDVES